MTTALASDAKPDSPIFELEPPQIIMLGDSPRARKSDPVTSHIAADASAVHLHETKQRVLQIVDTHGSLVGSEINEQYQLMAARMNWRRVAWDTPRKRAGELAEDGFLDGSETRTAEGNNLPESLYRLTDTGREALR